MSNIIANGIESVIYPSLKGEEKKVITNHFQVLGKSSSIPLVVSLAHSKHFFLIFSPNLVLGNDLG